MHFKQSSAVCFNLDQSKILSSGNGLKNDFGRFQTQKPYYSNIMEQEGSVSPTLLQPFICKLFENIQI